MARILSGANFGVRFPTAADAPPKDNFGRQLAMQLLGNAFKSQQQEKLFEQEQALATQKAEQLTAAQGEKTRLDTMFGELTRIKNIADPVQQRIAIARLGGDEINGGRDGSEFIEALNAGTPDELNLNIDKLTNKAAGFADQTNEFLKANAPKGESGLASAKTEIFDDGTVIQAMPDGTVQVRNPTGQIVQGQERLDVLKRSKEFEITNLEKKSEIAVSQAREIAGAKARQTRISEVTKEFGDQRRAAQASEVGLREAAILAERATQGLSGEVKLGFAKLFPSMDVSNEAALGASLKTLALDQLQKFKGPTTDFEFGVTEDISGKLGDPKTANIARIKSLQRNNWFVRRRSEQFRRHTQAGGDAESFDFNFGEVVKTKKGLVTLRDLQDTAVFHNISIDDVIKRFNQ